jgi:hypothetical protein
MCDPHIKWAQNTLYQLNLEFTAIIFLNLNELKFLYMVRNKNHIRNLSSFKNGVIAQAYYSKNKAKMVLFSDLCSKGYL